MEQYSLFDIIGPSMIGPSSSHTAGAAKVAYICRCIFSHDIKKVDFYLHGSFANTYKGHGTDLALIAGVCGLKPDDKRIATATTVAKELGIHIAFYKKDLGDVHPNTVKIVFEGTDGSVQEIMGSSIGGGKAKIIAIDDIEVSITGKYATLIAQHIDKPGFVADVSRVLADMNVNIAFMKLFREIKGEHAVIVIETDNTIPTEALIKIKDLEALNKLTFFEAIR